MTATALQEAFRHLENGRPQAAQQIFSTLLTQCVQASDAWNGLGLCAEMQQESQQAETAYRKAIALKPQEAEYHNNLAICLQTQGRFTEAAQSFRSLVKLKPDAHSYYNLALSLLAPLQGVEPQRALPTAVCHEALEALKQSLALQPDHAPSLSQLYWLLQTWPDRAGLQLHLQQKRTAQPDAAFWHLALGISYDASSSESTTQSAALQAYRSALQLEPDYFAAYQGLLAQLQSQHRHQQALKLARQLYRLEPSRRSLNEVLACLQNPIPANSREIQSLRQELFNLLQNPPAPNPTQWTFPRQLNFYHYYHGCNDRPLLERLATYYRQDLPPFPPSPTTKTSPPQRPRLGLVSLHFFDHSVMHLLLRALLHLLHSSEFESHVFFLYRPPDNREDQFTEQLRAAAEHFVYLPTDWQAAAQALASAELDLLIYPDLGMDSFTYLLALQRLAPIQLALPGHPVTTGMRSIDYYLSSQLIEAPEAQQYYTEKLILLPGLPDYPKPVTPTPKSREALNLPAGRLYFCPMTLFKLHPDFDASLGAILARDPEAQILFSQARQSRLHQLLQRRLAQIIPDSTRLHFLPWSSQSVFFQRLQAADLLLDSFYFGGGNTAYQALGLDCPLVTLEVPWSKGRWPQALYRAMQISAPVAQSPEEYVDLALDLAQNTSKNQALRQEIAAHKSVLFDNPTWSEALLAFCLSRVPGKRVKST